MSAEKKMEKTSVGIWRVFAVVVAVALAANAAQAMAGKANFAWWHLPTLMISYTMGACGDWLRRLSAVARLIMMRWRGCLPRRKPRPVDAERQHHKGQ